MRTQMVRGGGKEKIGPAPCREPARSSTDGWQELLLERDDAVRVDDFERVARLHEAADVGKLGRDRPGVDDLFSGHVDFDEDVVVLGDGEEAAVLVDHAGHVEFAERAGLP